MVALFVNGTKVGNLTEMDRLLPQFLRERQTVDFVDEDGRKLGEFQPGPLVPWNPALTREELDRRANSPGGVTLAEFWAGMGAK